MVLVFSSYGWPMKSNAQTNIKTPLVALSADFALQNPLYLETARPKANAQTHKSPGYGFDPCSCVSAAKAWTGFKETIGYARNWPINAEFGVVGGVIVLNEGKYGHVVEIMELRLNDYWVREYNYVPCAYSERLIPYGYEKIKGFWVEN